jgi:hypothetical protein
VSGGHDHAHAPDTDNALDSITLREYGAWRDWGTNFVVGHGDERTKRASLSGFSGAVPTRYHMQLLVKAGRSNTSGRTIRRSAAWW